MKVNITIYDNVSFIKKDTYETFDLQDNFVLEYLHDYSVDKNIKFFKRIRNLTEFQRTEIMNDILEQIEANSKSEMQYYEDSKAYTDKTYTLYKQKIFLDKLIKLYISCKNKDKGNNHCIIIDNKNKELNITMIIK